MNVDSRAKLALGLVVARVLVAGAAWPRRSRGVGHTVALPRPPGQGTSARDRVTTLDYERDEIERRAVELAAGVFAAHAPS